MSTGYVYNYYNPIRLLKKAVIVKRLKWWEWKNLGTWLSVKIPLFRSQMGYNRWDRSHSNKPVKKERKIESKVINKLNMRGQKREIF